jgi:NAD(P) transhydrogenase subunit beta
MSMNLVVLLYLVASICFIQALKGLSHPTTSIRGNVFGMTGMAIAVVTTAALIFNQANQLGQVDPVQGLGWVLLGLVVGGGAGTLMAQRVEMTKMPELVAFMHSMIGLAAVFESAPMGSLASTRRLALLERHHGGCCQADGGGHDEPQQRKDAEHP